MIHRWAPDLARAAQGIEVCKRPGCTAERRPGIARSNAFVYRMGRHGEWAASGASACAGTSMAKTRKRGGGEG